MKMTMGNRPWRFGSVLREGRQKLSSVVGVRPLPPQYIPLLTFNVQPPLNFGLEAMTHDGDDGIGKRDTHVLDDPGIINGFKIRKQVGRSQLFARTPTEC